MLSDQWENMIKAENAENAENAEQFFQFDTKRFDLDAVINGETQINNRDELTKGLKQIQLEKLLFGAVMHEGGSKVSCSFSATPGVASIPINVELYIVSDLAFTAVVLGKDGMSHSWCPMCKMRAAEMPNLNATGEIWQYAEMKKLGEEHQKKMRLFEQNDK
eukprot:scaffold16832_cov151-Skeletonema_marinoi.AAC.1